MYRRSPCHKGRIYFDFSEEVVKRLHASTFRSECVRSRTFLWVILSVLRPLTLICMFISHFHTLSLFLCAPDWFACHACDLVQPWRKSLSAETRPAHAEVEQEGPVSYSSSAFTCVSLFLLFLSLFRLRSWMQFCANTHKVSVWSAELISWVWECRWSVIHSCVVDVTL